MNKHLSANHKETIARIRAALAELVPANDAFKSESVQLRLVDGFVLPALLAEEVWLDALKGISLRGTEALSR